MTQDHSHTDATPSSPSIAPSALERIAAGDCAAVADCISRYSRLVWSLARRHTRSAADAEDATQDIFMSLWTHAKSFDQSRGSEPGFVATIARRRLIDRRRRLNLELDIDRSVDVSDAADSMDAGTSCQVQLDAEKATYVLKQLRTEWRQVLELGLLDGLSQSDISQHLKMPLGTVKSYMRRGILQIRRMLQITADGPAAADVVRGVPPISRARRPTRALAGGRRAALQPA